MKTFTASEWLLGSIGRAAAHLLGLGPAELGINLALSLGAAGGAVLLYVAANRGLRLLARNTPGPSTGEKTIRISRTARFVRTVAGLLIAVGVVYTIGLIWGLDAGELLAQGVGRKLVAGSLRVLLMAVVAVGAFELAAFLIHHLMDGLAERASDRRRAAQLQTLAPILRGLVQTIVVIMAGLMLMSEIGVKIAPLLAGAGVVGVAVGFGAQTLVKDFLTGFFLIVEDIVSVGDVVQISGSGGLVEDMTLRTIRLRDFDGTLHMFPYSEAQVIHNLTKSFSYYVFDLQISYESDIDHAVDVMRATGEGLAQDPEYAAKILAPIEVVGVDGLADSGVKLKARIKTQPIEQWNVGREYNRRIKLAFDRAGIQIPYPHLKLVLPPAGAGAEPA